MFGWDVGTGTLEGDQPAVSEGRHGEGGQTQDLVLDLAGDTLSPSHQLPAMEGPRDAEEEPGVEVHCVRVRQLPLSVLVANQERVALLDPPDHPTHHPELQAGAAGRDVPVVASPDPRLVVSLSPAGLLVGLTDPALQLVTDEPPLQPLPTEELQDPGALRRPVPEGGGEGGPVGEPGLPRAVGPPGPVQAPGKLDQVRLEGQGGAPLTVHLAGPELLLQLNQDPRLFVLHPPDEGGERGRDVLRPDPGGPGERLAAVRSLEVPARHCRDWDGIREILPVLILLVLPVLTVTVLPVALVPEVAAAGTGGQAERLAPGQGRTATDLHR